jgi:uncharacterized protein
MRRSIPLLAALGAALAVFQVSRWRSRANETSSWNSVRPGTALVTGASSGIGAAFARALAQRGYDLVLLARREARLQALADEIMREYPVKVQVFKADLSDPADIERAAECIAEIRDLDVLVNNAGFGLGGDYAAMDIESSLRMVQVHISATMHLTWAALPAMIAREKGGIINVSSLAAFLPGGGSTTYGATKAYLNFFSEALAAELLNSGVRVQALCPGFTYTEIHDSTGRPQLPAFLWMDAETVVAESLQALKENRLVVIPGRINQAVALLVRIPMIAPLIRLVRVQLKQGQPIHPV